MQFRLKIKNKLEDYTNEELLSLRDTIEGSVIRMSYTMFLSLTAGLVILFLALGLRHVTGIVLGLAFLVAGIMMLFTIQNYTVKSSSISLYRAVRREIEDSRVSGKEAE